MSFSCYFLLRDFSPRTHTHPFFPKGIRFIFHVDGIGSRFDIASTVICIGSGAAFFSVATIATDFILQYLHPKKFQFDQAKRQPVELNADEEEGEVKGKGEGEGGAKVNEGTKLISHSD